MAHSYSETTQITCPHCGEAFAFDVWLIIDAEEHPDLTERFRDGSLHRATCLHCEKPIGEVDAPCLLYQPGEVPPLLFAPAAQATEEQTQARASELIAHLQRALGEAWLSPSSLFIKPYDDSIESRFS